MTLSQDFGGQGPLPRNRILLGDTAKQLTRLPEASIDCAVTSPPYFGLRNYGVVGQLGLEASVHDWVANLVKVVDEVARVLKPAGTLWLNLGDSYSRKPVHGTEPKGLVLAPERLLLALAERGWLVRNKIVWAKPNPMPASVSDRLACTWEPMYLLARSRHYYFDLDAIRVPHTSVRTASKKPTAVRVEPPAWAGPLAGAQSGLDRLKAAGMVGHPLGKNPGDVWSIAKTVGHGEHHASFPEALAERPIRAGTPERVCSACGLAWRRDKLRRSIGKVAILGAFQPECGCQAGYQPGVVLDPFMGSGTVGVVAERLDRDWLGIELNPAFVSAATSRILAARDGHASSRAA